VKGVGDQQDYGMRIYDPRVGRFLSLDPIESDYPGLTPYQFAANTPIQAKDLDGLETWLQQQANASRRQAEIQIFSSNQYRGQTLSTYNPSNRSFTQKWRDSKNVFASATYDMANGLYTAPQQLTSGIRNADMVYDLGGRAHHAHGMQDQNLRTKEFADFATVVVPGGGAEVKGDELFNELANKALNELEEETTQQATKRAIGGTGKIGENYLKRLGGVSQRPFETSLGWRFVDQLVGTTAYESKVGYTTLTTNIQKQIAKDAELISTGAVKKVVWTFFESKQTADGCFKKSRNTNSIN
jgi:hypothetical protein